MRTTKLQIDSDIERLLGDLYGPLAKRHHARYHPPDTPFHLIIRTFQGRPLLTPNPRLKAIATGVLAKGLEVFDTIELFAYAALSNHLHLQLRGQPHQIPRFVAYLKRELTLRWGRHIGWSDSLWHRGYVSTALPTAKSQVRCFAYIFSHGVKEGFVRRPEDWTGLHMAHHGVGGEPIAGEWVNGTRLGKALWKEQQKPDGQRRRLDPARYTRTIDLHLSPLPVWSELSAAARSAAVTELVAEIVQAGETSRGGAPPVGMERVCSLSHEVRMPLPRPPWFEERQGFICWSDPEAPETRAYVMAYWEFQLAYRTASDAFLAGDRNAVFPAGAFKPVTFVPWVDQAAKGAG
jgi:REP element-mobilizing transposase RayT